LSPASRSSKDALVYCEAYAKGLEKRCGHRMYRKVIVEINVAA